MARWGARAAQVSRRPQSYIETNLNVQRLMPEWDFSQAQTWGELRRAHERWLADFNSQAHRAHQKPRPEPEARRSLAL